MTEKLLEELQNCTRVAGATVESASQNLKFLSGLLGQISHFVIVHLSEEAEKHR